MPALSAVCHTLSVVSCFSLLGFATASLCAAEGEASSSVLLVEPRLMLAVCGCRQDMIYKRLYNGNVVMRSLCGSPPHLLDPATAATAVANQLRLVALQPKRLWGVAHVLKQHTEAAVTAAAAVSAAAGRTKAAAEAGEGSMPGAEEEGATEAGSEYSSAPMYETATLCG